MLGPGAASRPVLAGAPMFVLTALVYPVVLAALCCGAGLLVDRVSGGFLPGMLMPAVGMAALVGVSQLTTYIPVLAPATPYILALLAATGLIAGWTRVRVLASRCRTAPWQALTPVLAYALALAPVLLAGRPTLSSYMALTDSAVHLIGAEYLIRHGQDYSHIDLANSVGQYINAYYRTGYPSGADTLLGGSTALLGLPLIWTFQPFNAFTLAVAACPAWLLVRSAGTEARWAALGALTVSLPALVYAYELIGSVKEMTALPMILTLGALVVCHRRWLPGGPNRAIPFGVVVAAGLAAIGVAFLAWALGAAAALLAVTARALSGGRRAGARALALLACGIGVALLFSISTWSELSASVKVATGIASTSNPGNLHAPLRPIQMFGTWLDGSYKLAPDGTASVLTYGVIGIAIALAAIGAVELWRRRRKALGAWIASMGAVWLALTLYGTTWTDAKTLMLTSPIAMLLAWAGVAALRASRLGALAPLLAGALAAGVLASDGMLYHSSNLAPTGRYEELASLDRRFAGRGPALFTDYDEYAMYELRDLDVGGPNFIYPPPALRGVVSEHGQAVDLNRVPAEALRAYPLIITRRDPLASRPPSAYALLWEGRYYQVWGRRPGAQPAIAHVELSGAGSASCGRIAAVARLADARRARLIAATAPDAVEIAPADAAHPSAWDALGGGALVMNGPGRLQAAFRVPSAGVWEVWVRGDFMRSVRVSVDGRPLGSISGQISGSSLSAEPAPPLGVRLSAGAHTLLLARGGATLAPGDGGWAVLDGIFLTPADASSGALDSLPPADWRVLCGRALQWVEAA